MVFQNYALYPHLNVFDNMAFGLRLRKTPKDEIQRRVRQAADVLGLEDLLDRKPKNLSGGQRQRVAMGRAIVRQPVAFLMDEPLSNLDAKLRVQMRAEISRIQADFGTTTIYVTHDQVEAMTMGDRVAVIKQGRLQQVDTAAGAVRLAGESVRRGVHRIAVDEHGRGVHRARRRRPLGRVRRHPVADARRRRLEAARSRSIRGTEGRAWDPTRGHRGRPIESDAPDDRRFRTTVDLREALGSEVLVHFTVAAAPVLTEDTKELARDMGLHDAQHERGATTSTFVARLDPRTRAQERESIELVVDTARLHFFDPQTGLGIDTEGGSA